MFNEHITQGNGQSPRLLLGLMLLSLLLVSGCATYGSYDSYQSGRYVYADVLDYEPIEGNVRVNAPRVVCYEEYNDRRPSAAAPIFGAIIGGLIGSAIDGGYDRSTGTVIGAVAGGAIAHDIDRTNSRRGTQVRERCDEYDDYHYEEGVAGYKVTYQYAGKIGELQTDYVPDDVIRVPYELVSDSHY